MNEQGNTRLIEQFYRSNGAGDMESVLRWLAEDVVWTIPEMENVPFAGTWEGRDGVKRFFETVAEVQDVVEFVPERFVAQGDTVVALGRFTMRIKATGSEVSSRWAHVWTIEGDKAVRFFEYVDTAAVTRAHSAA